MSTTKDLGDRGENLTADWLLSRGYQILDRRWRCRYGELDLVGRTPEGTICFVEVKLRGGFAGLPREAVDRRKREKLRAAAESYLALHDLGDAPARFDVAEVYTDGNHRPVRLEYLEDAFQ